MDENYVLATVLKQKGTKMLEGAFMFSTESEQLTYLEFQKMAREKEKELIAGRDLSLREIENLHWQNMCETERKYAVNNAISLFGEGTIAWNLDKFTKVDSNIHFKKTHHEMDVS